MWWQAEQSSWLPTEMTEKWGIFNSSYKFQTHFSEDKKTGEKQILNNSVSTIGRAWLAVNTYFWVLILIGCYKHKFDFISNCSLCTWCCSNLGDKADAVLYQNLLEWLMYLGVFWLPSILYSIRFHNYKSNCTCWQRTTARLITIGNFNYTKLELCLNTTISSLYTATIHFSLHQLIRMYIRNEQLAGYRINSL